MKIGKKINDIAEAALYPLDYKLKKITSENRSSEEIKKSIENIDKFLEKLSSSDIFQKYYEHFGEYRINIESDHNELTGQQIELYIREVRHSEGKNKRLEGYFSLGTGARQRFYLDRNTGKVTNMIGQKIGENGRDIISRYEKEILEIESKMKKQIMMKKAKNTIKQTKNKLKNIFSKKKILD